MTFDEMLERITRPNRQVAKSIPGKLTDLEWIEKGYCPECGGCLDVHQDPVDLCLFYHYCKENKQHIFEVDDSTHSFVKLVSG